MNSINSIKKTLFFTIPLAIGLNSCSINQNIPYDPVYGGKEDYVKPKKENLEEKTFFLNYNFNYNYSFNWDSDFDGIYDWADPWPYDFGPYVDMNNNGIIDNWDAQTNNHFISHWYNHNHFNFGWHNSFYWDYHSILNNHNFQNNDNYYYGPRKGMNHKIPRIKEEPSPRSPRIKSKKVEIQKPERNYQRSNKEINYQRKKIQKKSPKTYYRPRSNTNPKSYSSPRLRTPTKSTHQRSTKPIKR